MRAVCKHFICNTLTKSHAGTTWSFSSWNSNNNILNEKFNPQIISISALFFPKSRSLFPICKKCQKKSLLFRPLLCPWLVKPSVYFLKRREITEVTIKFLKVMSDIILLICVLILIESTFQIRKNGFYFTLKTPFILEVLKFQIFRISDFMMSSNA